MMSQKKGNTQVRLRHENLSDLSERIRIADSVSITIKKLSTHKVRSAAIAWWNRHRASFAGNKPIRMSFATDRDTLNRITVNYIRHRLSSYDGVLSEFLDQPARRAIARKLHARTLVEIAKIYPEFKLECKRQMHAREKRDTERIQVWINNDC